MKKLFLIVFLFLSYSCYPQESHNDDYEHFVCKYLNLDYDLLFKHNHALASDTVIDLQWRKYGLFSAANSYVVKDEDILKYLDKDFHFDSVAFKKDFFPDKDLKYISSLTLEDFIYKGKMGDSFDGFPSMKANKKTENSNPEKLEYVSGVKYHKTLPYYPLLDSIFFDFISKNFKKIRYLEIDSRFGYELPNINGIQKIEYVHGLNIEYSNDIEQYVLPIDLSPVLKINGLQNIITNYIPQQEASSIFDSKLNIGIGEEIPFLFPIQFYKLLAKDRNNINFIDWRAEDGENQPYLAMLYSQYFPPDFIYKDSPFMVMEIPDFDSVEKYNNLHNGDFRLYYSNDSIAVIGQIKNDKFDGWWNFYNCMQKEHCLTLKGLQFYKKFFSSPNGKELLNEYIKDSLFRRILEPYFDTLQYDYKKIWGLYCLYERHKEEIPTVYSLYTKNKRKKLDKLADTYYETYKKFVFTGPRQLANSVQFKDNVIISEKNDDYRIDLIPDYMVRKEEIRENQNISNPQRIKYTDWARYDDSTGMMLAVSFEDDSLYNYYNHSLEGVRAECNKCYNKKYDVTYRECENCEYKKVNGGLYIIERNDTQQIVLITYISSKVMVEWDSNRQIKAILSDKIHYSKKEGDEFLEQYKQFNTLISNIK